MNKSFRLKIDSIGVHNILHFSHLAHDINFSIIPTLGCNLNGFCIKGQQILESANDINKIEKQSIKAFSGAQLFPFPNRIKNGKYSMKGQTYQLPINEPLTNNSLHGLIYNKTFELVSIDEYAGIIKLKYDYNRENNGYPFHVLIENSYQLSKNSLTIATTIENKSDHTIPVGHGWHPYFVVNNEINDAYLQIPATKYYLTGKQHIPTGEVALDNSFLNATKIGSIDIDKCFKIESNNDIIAQLKYPNDDMTISLLTNGYPYLQVYIPPHRNSIALEPQTSIPDAFNNSIGCIYLEPNKSMDLKFQIKIDLESW